MSEAEKKYSIVRLNKDNLKDLARLHGLVYKPVSDNYYFKKYDTAYTKVQHVGFIAYNPDKEPIAYYGVIPCFLQYRKEIKLAAQSADTMTHPQYRYKGMFMELSNKTFELCRELGISLIFGFPNQNSYHGAIKLGWKMTEAMDCFTIRSAALPIQSISKKNGLFERINNKYSSFILQKYLTQLKGFGNPLLIEDFAGVHRSPEYLQYKTYSPTRVLKLDEVQAWVSNKNGLVIGDLNGVTAENFNVAIDKIKRIASQLGIKQVQFHSSPDTALHKLFNEAYTPAPSFPVLFQDFNSEWPLEKIKFSFADIDIF